MLVKGERGGNSQALHQGEAGAVGEAPSLVPMSLKDFPGAFQVILREIDKCGVALAEQRLAGPNRALRAEPRFQKRQDFVPHLVPLDQPLPFFFKPPPPPPLPS